jgi:hypothetical protein
MFGGYMKFINISANDVAEGLKSRDGYWDYYRKFINYDDNDYIGLYYKEYLDIDDNNEENIEDHIKTSKTIWNGVDMWPWDHHMVERLFARINRISEAQKEVPCSLDVSVISGIVLCDNYPVGVLIPKKILNYVPLGELVTSGISLTKEDKETIFKQVDLWVKSLIKHEVYPTLYSGNILVNPNDYSDVILDGLDGPQVCRVENKRYVEELAGRGLDLREEAITDYNSLKEEILRKDKRKTR